MMDFVLADANPHVAGACLPRRFSRDRIYPSPLIVVAEFTLQENCSGRARLC